MPPRGRPNEPATDRELNENDIINVINGDMERDDPFLRYTNRDGLDFVYDFKAGRAILAAAEEAAARNKIQVEIDSEFLYWRLIPGRLSNSTYVAFCIEINV
eukprot:scaffold365002_cov31-Attheya_sp.AAC.1